MPQDIFKHHITSIQGMHSSFLWSKPWASGSAHWPRTSSAVDGRFSWVSKGVRVASGDLKMQRILKHLTEPTGERQHPFGTRLCLQSLVCYTLVPADAEKGLREAPASTCSVAEGCADGHFLPTQRRLAEEPMVYVLPSCRSSVSPIRRKANDQRLCFPRLPASVPGFSIAVL